MPIRVELQKENGEVLESTGARGARLEGFFPKGVAGFLLAALALVACTSGSPSTLAPSSPTHVSVPSGSQLPTGSIEPNGIRRILSLGQGKVTVTYFIEALDPPTRPYDVLIEAPAGAGLAMWMTTPYGSTLHVTQDTLDHHTCGQQKGRLLCVLHFPALEAQHAGPWTAHVVKRTTAPATVAITVVFMALGESS
jgi:hypothetical protein